MINAWNVSRRATFRNVRFWGITRLGSPTQCTGRAVEKLDNGERRVRIGLLSANEFGEPTIVGEAVFALA